VGYDLLQVTAPDPSQIIPLEADTLAGRPVSSTIRASDSLTMRPGERLVLRSGLILDHNGHLVPDDTPVEFVLNFVTDNLQARQTGSTVDGVAATGFTPNHAGRVQISVTSQDAARSETLQVTVVDDSAALLAGTPFAGAGRNPPAGGTPAPNVTTEVAVVEREAVRQLEVFDFGLALLGLMLLSGLGFIVGLSATLTLEGGIRVVLGSVVAGLGGYIDYGGGFWLARELDDPLDTRACTDHAGDSTVRPADCVVTLRGYRQE
jgi:beta-N-acetylhexosaminidase